MISSNYQLRAKGRADLKGHWAEAAMLAFVAMLIALFVTNLGSVVDICVFGPRMLHASTDFKVEDLLTQDTPGLFAGLVSLLLIPMGWSFDMTFLANHRHESNDPFGVGNLFTGYRRFWHVFATQFLVSLLVLLCCAVFIVPLLIGMVLASLSVIVLALCVSCGILALCLVVWVAMQLAMVPFILRDHPEMGIIDILCQSASLMAGYKCKYLLLQLSFIGWALLCIPTLGIGLLWLYPYIGQTQANFYEEVKAAHEAASVQA